jgi:CBS domain-containing protein
MKASDVMTHPVLAVDPDTPLAQAVRLMIDHRISGLPVTASDGHIVGMLTEGDLLRRVEIETEGRKPGWLSSFLMPEREAAKYVLTHGRRVSEVMTADVITVTEETSLSVIVTLMQKHHIKRVPVAADGKLVGVVSRADLVRKLGEALSASSGTASDGVIRQAILAAMKKDKWAPGNRISVAVHEGVVQLDGCLYDTHQRDAIGVLAENTLGVRDVQNRIVCIEPHTGLVTYDPDEHLAHGASV